MITWLSDLASLYGVARFAKLGFWKVSELCQDGKVALSRGVNQVILVDLESGEFENLVICR